MARAIEFLFLSRARMLLHQRTRSTPNSHTHTHTLICLRAHIHMDTLLLARDARVETHTHMHARAQKSLCDDGRCEIARARSRNNVRVMGPAGLRMSSPASSNEFTEPGADKHSSRRPHLRRPDALRKRHPPSMEL